MSAPGLYVHIPFCGERCDYCAFVTYTDMDHLHETYVAALRKELRTATSESTWEPFGSIFFGGGTPSRLAPSLIGSVIADTERQHDCEITVEINPEDATADYLEQLVAIGVTRFSVGIQSIRSHVLAELGRTHRGDDVADLVERIGHSGVTTWSMDLILGARSERDEDLVATIETLLDGPMAPPHLSCYLLTVEKGTPLSRDVNRHPDDDVLAHRYELLDELLSSRGYDWYEVSNWSKPGHECRHNQLYWDQGDYLGIGVAAHSHRAGHRWWNIANLETYLQRIEGGISCRGGEEAVDAETSQFELLALELRTRSGVPASSFDESDPMLGEEFVVLEGGRYVLTLKGRLMADEVARRLIVESET